MRRIAFTAFVFLSAGVALAESAVVQSPDGSLSIGFTTDAKGLSWSLSRKGTELIAPSRLGLSFIAAEPLAEMRLVAQKPASGDGYNESTVDLVESEARAVRVGLGQTEVVKLPRKLSIVFRAYDGGAAFRYVVPEQEAFDGFQLSDELTEWRFADDPEAWTTCYKADATGEEAEYRKARLLSVKKEDFVGHPVVVETKGGSVALCEAALVNWAGLFYKATEGGFRAHLARLPKSHAAAENLAVIRETPAASPWRVVIVGDDGVDLIRKKGIIAKLNPPPEEGLDFSWVKPGATSWDWWVESNNSLSTEVSLKLVDFAAEMGWPYHTIDGGWYGFARRPNHGPNVKLQPRKGFDLEGIVRHAAAKGVGIWVWIHWEEINDIGIEETFARLEKWGVKGVKTDFLSRQDQWIVNWYEKVCRVAAKHRIMVNFHGAFHPTGTERTWPNNLTREGVLGNEYSLFCPRIKPAHTTTLPFTRYLLGPGDFTPGAFANVFSKDFVSQKHKGHRYGDETDRCPHWAESIGTRAYSLALCIAYDSPLMTLCDWPERYRGAPGVEALRALPTVWKATTPLEGRCGEYYAVVRETDDGRFYYAAFTDKRRNLDLKLDFLGEGSWKMRVFADDPELTPADAKEIALGERTVKKGDKIGFWLCDEGGAVAIFERTDK